MVRKCLCIVAALCLALLGFGCKSATSEQKTEPPYPTLPDFHEELTPAQQLTAAISKTEEQSAYEIRYGTKTVSDGQAEENSQLQNVTQQNPFDGEKLEQYLPYLPQRDGFLEDFCGRSLRVIPSNTGLLRFQISDLSWEQAWAMMYDQKPEGAYDSAVCEIAFEVDVQDRLSRFEIILTMENETLTWFLAITFPGES